MPSRSEMLGVASPSLVAPAYRADIEHRIKEATTRIFLMNGFLPKFLLPLVWGSRAAACCDGP